MIAFDGNAGDRPLQGFALTREDLATLLSGRFLETDLQEMQEDPDAADRGILLVFYGDDDADIQRQLEDAGMLADNPQLHQGSTQEEPREGPE